MNDFHVILPSNVNGVNNKANHFISSNDKHIDLSEGVWKVGLTDISFYKNNVSLIKGCGFEVECDVETPDFRKPWYVFMELSEEELQISNGGFYADHFWFYIGFDNMSIAIDKEKTPTLKRFRFIFDTIDDAVSMGFKTTQVVVGVKRHKTGVTYTILQKNESLKYFEDMITTDTYPIMGKRISFIVEEIHSGSEILTYTLNNNISCKNSKDLVKVLNTDLTLEKIVSNLQYDVTPHTHRPQFEYDDVNEKIKIIKNNILENNELNDALFNKKTIIFKKMKLLGGLNFILGMDSDKLEFISINKEEVFESSFPQQLSRGVGSMYVYCNICNETRVGDAFVPLLRQIVLPPSRDVELRGMVEVITLDSPMYVPIKFNTINNIEIEVRTNLGDYFPFLEGSVTTLTLHFKRYE